MSADEPPVKSSGLLHITLRGLPELELFDNDNDRTRAVNELQKEAGNPRSGSFWLAIAILIAGVIAVRFAFQALVPLSVLPGILREMLQTIVLVGSGIAILYRLHRYGAQADLRSKLLEFGVPVCRRCGYLLRGLSREAPVCPECGSALEARAREILARQCNALSERD